MSSNAQKRAKALVAELIFNGASLSFRPSVGALPASFVYELSAGGNRQHCRQLVAQAKSDKLVWRAFLDEVALRSGGRGDAA